MHNCGVSNEQICEGALHPCGRLPQVPVGERDSGGVKPAIPGYKFFMAEVIRITKNPDLFFFDFIGDNPVGWESKQLYINKSHPFWEQAYTSQVEKLAQEVIEEVFGP